MVHFITREEKLPPCNAFPFPALLQKLKDPQCQGAVVSHYQKPQRLINNLMQWFSRPDDWALDAFSGTGTTTVCALKQGRNMVSVDIDAEKISFIRTRISSCESFPDENEELGAKNGAGDVKGTYTEIQPPLTGRKDEEVEFVDLEPVEQEATKVAPPARLESEIGGTAIVASQETQGDESPIDWEEPPPVV